MIDGHDAAGLFIEDMMGHADVHDGDPSFEAISTSTANLHDNPLNMMRMQDQGDLHATHHTIVGDGTDSSFCKGMPMVMYMDGFQWAWMGESGCLSFYFPSWQLDTRHKFVLACFVVFAMGVWCEAVSRWRHDLSQKTRRAAAAARNGNQGSGGASQRRQATRLWYLQILLHGVSGLSAYVLMLATMTYSLEFLCAIILGLMTGYFVFGGDSYKHAGSPCCALFDDDDATVATVLGGGGGSGMAVMSAQDVNGLVSFHPQNIFLDGDCCSTDNPTDEDQFLQQPLLQRNRMGVESKEDV